MNRRLRMGYPVTTVTRLGRQAHLIGWSRGGLTQGCVPLAWTSKPDGIFAIGIASSPNASTLDKVGVIVKMVFICKDSAIWQLCKGSGGPHAVETHKQLVLICDMHQVCMYWTLRATADRI